VNQHAINEPRDLTMAQYSVPFCTALAFFRDPTDPRSFSTESLDHPGIRTLARNTRVELLTTESAFHAPACRVTLTLKNGVELTAEGHDFKGTPTMPLTRPELLEKFLTLTADRGRARAERLFDELAEVDKAADLGALKFAL